MKLRLATRWRIVLLVLLVVSKALAQDPKVRMSLANRGEPWVGQRVTIVVELLAPGYFSGASTMDLPSPSGLLLVPPAEGPVLSTETIDGTTYTLQRHEISAFPRKAGELVIPAFTVRFQFKHNPLDKQAVPATVKTQSLRFTAKAPPGAERLGNLISAHNLKAEETWKPQPVHAKAGDAFTRTITYSAPDIPAMAFPPFPAEKIDGVRIYPKPPEVLDVGERGEFRGQRRDAFTYVCQRPGHFVIPATRLTWFDLDEQKLQVIDFPAQTLEVAPNPAMVAAKSSPAKAPVHYTKKFWAVIGFVLLVLAALLAPARAWQRLLAPLRPIHLAPLNPSDGSTHRRFVMKSPSQYSGSYSSGSR